MYVRFLVYCAIGACFTRYSGYRINFQFPFQKVSGGQDPQLETRFYARPVAVECATVGLPLANACCAALPQS